LDARKRLHAYGVGFRVVSMPCFELFYQQDPAYRKEVLWPGLKVAIEAAAPIGWTRSVDHEVDEIELRG
jgi:transketolase